jgi:hypothetical protein
MARQRLDLTSLDVTSFEIPQPGASAPNFAAARANLPWCCTGCDSGCGIFPTAGGCESGGKTHDLACGVDSAYPCDSVDICAA